MDQTKKKTKLRKGPLIVILFLLVLCCLGVGGYYLFVKADLFAPKKKTVVEKKKVEVQKEDVDYEAKVFMVGDALIHSSIYIDAKQNDGSYDFKPMLQFIKPIASKYDIAYYNQETILGGANLGILTTLVLIHQMLVEMPLLMQDLIWFLWLPIIRWIREKREFCILLSIGRLILK